MNHDKHNNNQDQSSSLIKSTGIYALSNGFAPLLMLLALPLFTHYLSPRDFGIMAMFGVILGITRTFTGLSVRGAIARQYFEKDRIDFPAYLTNCLFILLVSTAVVGGVLYMLAGRIEQFTGFPAHWIWAITIISACQFLNLITTKLWQVKEKPIPYAVFQGLLAITILTISLFLVIKFRMNWKGRITGILTSSALFALAGLFMLIKNRYIKLIYVNKYVMNALRFGVPLIPHAFGMFIIGMTDRILITNMISLEDTGIYGVGARISMIIMFTQDAFNRAWMPFLYRQLKKNNHETRCWIVSFTYKYMLALLSLAICFSIVAPWLIETFLNKDFHASATFIKWLAIGYAFNGMYKMCACYIFYEQKTHLLAIITCVTASINIILSFLLIKTNGAVGAAQGTCLAYLISFVLTWLVAAKTHKMPWMGK